MVLTLKTPELRAFAISVAVHALLFLLLILFAGRNLGNPLEVRVIVERDADLTRLDVPDDEQDEITPERRRPQRKNASSQGPSRQSAKGGRNNSNAPAMPEDPWNDYERKMFGRKEAAQKGSKAQAAGTAWGNEKLGKTSKQGTQENVVVPKGDSKASTRWKKGAARRLISLPAIDYPESVRKKSGQGQVELLIEVNEQGRVEEVEVVKSSGYSRLDMNARNAYRNAVFSASTSGERATGVVIVTFRVRE